MEVYMFIEISKLREICVPSLVNAGISENDALVVFNHLLDEELLGKHSHGFIRIPSILNVAKSFCSPRSVETENHGLFAHRNLFTDTLGLIAAYESTILACKMAKENGLSLISAIGYKGTTGALGYYGRMIAEEGYVGIISCSSEYAVAPWGGKEAILGTNPLAIAIPNGDMPIICDFATAAMTYGDLMLAVKEGRKVPYGVVLDSDGKDSHDPDDANNGCQLPMAGHKGYALGLALEVLSGLFIGAKAGKDAVKSSDGILIFVVKPDTFVSGDQFSSNLNRLINEIKSSALAADSKGIRIPGESSLKKIRKGRESGLCDIPESVYKDLLQ